MTWLTPLPIGSALTVALVTLAVLLLGYAMGRSVVIRPSDLRPGRTIRAPRRESTEEPGGDPFAEAMSMPDEDRRPTVHKA